MLTKKDRRILNLTKQVENRDKKIDDLVEQRNFYIEQLEISKSNNTKLEETLEKINDLASSNKYDNEKAVFSKIKELSMTAKSNR